MQATIQRTKFGSYRVCCQVNDNEEIFYEPLHRNDLDSNMTEIQQQVVAEGEGWA